MDAPEHPIAALQRHHLALHEELHARPAMAVHSPGLVSYWAQHGVPRAQAWAVLVRLHQHCDLPPPPAGASHVILHTAHFTLKFEQHGEFVSWQVSCPWQPDANSQKETALQALPRRLVEDLAAWPLIAATHVRIVRKDADECAAPFDTPQELDALAQAMLGTPTEVAPAGCDATALLAARISDQRGAVLTTLQLGPDGFTRFLLIDAGLPRDRLARDVQRLCEIEAYRMLAMLGFPVARSEGSALQAIEAELQRIVDDMAHARALDDTAAFDALLRLSADIEHAAARTRYRLSASRAYHRIVVQRLSDLREERVESHQKLSAFFNRRFAPAMALCESTDQRITDIAERINRAVDLARVRVEARREANNQELLRSLAHRQQLQLRLQQTVEGLSVVAISYYAVSLVAYLAKAAKGLALPGGIELQPDVVTAVAVLPVVGAVAWMVSRIHHRLGR